MQLASEQEAHAFHRSLASEVEENRMFHLDQANDMQENKGFRSQQMCALQQAKDRQVWKVVKEEGKSPNIREWIKQ